MKTITPPKFSNWECRLFGHDGNGISWTPEEGQVPNRLVRFWMKVFFNCKWSKTNHLKGK